MAPEGGDCGCGHDHCEHVEHRIPHPILKDTLADDTITELFVDTDVLNVPRTVARHFSQYVLEESLYSSLSIGTIRCTVTW